MKLKKMALFSILMTPLFLHASTVDLRIIETTDLHGNMMNYDYYQDKTTEAYGLVKTAELIKQARSEVKNSVLVDNGDLIQGSPMADYALKKGLSEDQIHPVYKVMNQLNYDVANIGNHEFNFGLDYLKQALSGARFPYVNANVYDVATGDHYFTPYLIQSKEVVDREGKTQQVKIGYIGFVPPQIMQWDKLNLNGKVYVADITKTAENLIPKMKNEGADVIVVIAHSGVSSEPYKALAENSVYYLTQVKDVNAVMFGHSHGLFPSSEFINLPKSDIEKGTINGVPSVMPGQWGSHLGVVDLILEGETGQWQVKQGTSEIRAIYDTQTKQALVGVDHQLIETLQLDHEGTREFVNQPIGKSEVEINSYLALFQDSPATRLINEAQTDYVKNAIQGDPDLDGIPVLSAIAPFKAGGRKNDPSAYVEVAKGELTFRNAADIYLFPNLLTAVKIKGSDLKEWLECSAGMFNQIDVQKSEPQYLLNWEEFRTYNFDVISGLQYKIDVTQPPKYDGNCQLIHPESERVKDLTFEGKPIDLEQDFIIATNNYRAYSGIFPGTGEEKVLFNSPDDMRIILSNYIIKQTEEKGSIDVTLENDWRLSPIQSDIKLDIRVETSPSLNAKSYIEKEAYYPMHYLQNDSVGFAIYQLDLQSNSSLNK